MSKKLEMAKTLMMAVVEANGSRQVVAAVASALFRTGGEDADLGDSSKYEKQTVQQLELHEQVLGVVEEYLGPGVGIGMTCRKLREGGYFDLASTVSGVRRNRRMAAHPTTSLTTRLKSALQNLVANVQEVNGPCVVNVQEVNGLAEGKVQEEQTQTEGGCVKNVQEVNGPAEVKVQEEQTNGPCVVNVQEVNGPCVANAQDEILVRLQEMAASMQHYSQQAVETMKKTSEDAKSLTRQIDGGGNLEPGQG